MQDAVEAPTPVLTTVQDIGIQSGAVVDGATIQTVDARRLHGFLGSAKAFTTWMLERIEKYGFVDGVDFTTTTNLPNREVSSRGRQRIDYHVSLDMAKELAMVERTDKGREARKYFIECEKKLHEVAPGGETNPTMVDDDQVAPAIVELCCVSNLGSLHANISYPARHCVHLLTCCHCRFKAVIGNDSRKRVRRRLH